MQIQYTSGTTGFPKGAVLRHRGITNNARFNAQILQAEPGDVWVSTMFGGVPTMVLAQLDHPDFAGTDLSRIRCIYGGATFPPALVRRVEVALADPVTGERLPAGAGGTGAHPGVMDVAVVGVPNDHWGEQVAAFIREQFTGGS